jgi:hypothetical protein
MGKSRFIGMFDTKEKATLAYEIAREKLDDHRLRDDGREKSPELTEAAVNTAREAAFEGLKLIQTIETTEN